MQALKHPATLVASVAFFVAAGGGAAVASGLISGKRIVNHSIPEKKLTAAAIKALRGHRGPQGLPGIAGAQGPKGDTGPSGQQGPVGTARAWAVVFHDGGFSTRSGSVADATHLGTGHWCVELYPQAVNANIAAAVVSPWHGDDSTAAGNPGTTTQVEWSGQCGTNGEEVFTWAVNGTSVTPADEGFAIVVP
jgi:hypothetical protein